MNMDRWEGKVAVVTGASSGIGFAISEELVKVGVSVIGLARRFERMEKLSSSLREAKGKFYARQCDVTKEEDLLEAFKWVNDELGGVDILVSNAGVNTHSRIIDDDIDSFHKILDVNVLASAITIREAVASMKSRDVPGYIIAINSVSGHGVTPFVRSLYSASKFALRAMTETVRKELAAEPENKIKITYQSWLCQNRTGLAVAAGGSSKMYDELPSLEASDIADAVLYVLGTPLKVQVTEFTIRPVGEAF